MSVQVFTGTTTEAAMSRVRKALGDDAVIVDVRGAGGQVAVLASSPARGKPRGRPPAVRPESHERTERAGRPRSVPAADPQGSLGGAERGVHALAARSQRRAVEEELANLFEAERERVTDRERSTAGRRAPTPPAPPAILRTLRGLDLPHDICERLLGIAENHADGWSRIHGWVESLWPVAVPRPRSESDPLAVAFLGGRGVGRSTLCRGLAARAVIASDGGVLWIQVGFPGRRLADADDLRAPVGVDLRIAHYVGEFAEIARDHPHAEVVIVDLPGIDVFDAEERAALDRFVQGARHVFPGLGLHAVLPATWSTRQACRTVAALQELPLQGIAWTWMDEAVDAGTIVSATMRTHTAPAFVHGDRLGDGSTSRVADWAPLLGSLAPELLRSPA